MTMEESGSVSSTSPGYGSRSAKKGTSPRSHPAVKARRGEPPPKPAPPAAGPAGASAADSSPSSYIARINRATAQEILGPIEPDELLGHAHRAKHPVELAAPFAATRFIGLTGTETAAREPLR